MPATVESDLTPEVEELAQRFVATMEARDVDGWLATYADDAVIWHSYDGAEVTPAFNADLLRGLLTHVVSEISYADVRRHRIATGYVQQHTVQMTSKTGDHFSIGACLVVTVTEGKVQRLDEYLDSRILSFGAPDVDTAPA